MSRGTGGEAIRGAEAAAAYLEGLIDFERQPGFSYARLGLGPIRALLGRVGDPQRGLAVVHVAGSKGKGSTALLAEALFRAAGRRVGTFTSPHLERWTERFRIDGAELEGSLLGAAVERLRPHIEALRAGEPGLAPTFFDATTAAALWLFAEAAVDVAILEVGLGGRLDSTNVVRPRVCCITSVELEHTDKLGDTHAAIAGEKAGILKPGVPAVMGPLPGEAEAVVAARARALGVPLARFGADFGVEVLARSASGTRLRYWDGPRELDLELPVLGAHQAANAALALASARRAGVVAGSELDEVAPRAFASATLPGRVELLQRRPWIVVDGAHTPASARALREALAVLPRSRTGLVLSVSADKNLGALLAQLVPAADEVTVTRAEPARSLRAEEVARAVAAAAPNTPLRVVPNPHLALRAARQRIGSEDLLCVTGSVYLAGIARRILSPSADAERVVVSRRAALSGAGTPAAADPRER